VVSVEGKPLEQITKQLHKLINVLKIAELPLEASVERELALIKVHAEAAKRSEILGIVEIFRAKITDVDAGAVMIEATGTPDKIASLEELLRPYGIVEMVRTGRVALARGSGGLKPPGLRPVPVISQAS
jgi:acetolactate synthase-1/3 small subunit